MRKVINKLLISVILLSNFVFAESNLIKVKVNNQELKSDVDPIVIEGTTLVPARAVLESLDLEVTWDRTTNMVTGKGKDTLIKLEIEGVSATVNGKVMTLAVPSMVINQRIMIPARFVGEAIGAKVSWDRQTNTVSIDKSVSNTEVYKNSLTYSNLVDSSSQEEVRKSMKSAGILTDNIDSFFQEVNIFNAMIEEISLVKDGFTTIDNLEPEYDLYEMQNMLNAKSPEFIGYNCRITSYDLMKDSISIGKPDTKNSGSLIFDKNALENSPKEIFTQEEQENFETLYSFIPTERTKDISVHLEKVKEDWRNKEIEFSNQDKRSIISVFFHDEEDNLFIGHMGVLLSNQDGKLLFLEKLSFQAPYQAVKFDNRTELNDYLMNMYDISWNQPTAKPFIMENDKLLEGYRENPNNPGSNLRQ